MNAILQNCGLVECPPEEKKSVLNAYFLKPAPRKQGCEKAIKIENIGRLSSWLSWIGCVPLFDGKRFQNYIGVEKHEYDKLKEEIEKKEFARLKTGWINTKPEFEPQKEIIFVEQIVIPKQDKILIVGDVHSSLTSLLSILSYWLDQHWLSDNFKLAKGFHLFFLGDVFDRGPYGTELIALIFLLKKANKDRVTYINGNHENCETYKEYGMVAELMLKFNYTTVDEWMQHMSFLQYQPSMVVVKFGDETFQLSHGAFTENAAEQSRILQLIQSTQSFLFVRDFAKSCERTLEKDIDNQKWGDFVGTPHDLTGSSRGKYMKVFGWKSTEKYLNKMHMTAIISGHQDLSNFTMLTTPLCSKDGKEIDPNYTTLRRPLGYGSASFPTTVAFTPGKDFIAVNTSTALDAKGNKALQYDCFLLLKNE